MDKYDDEMYKYLTIPENYKAAKEVVELLNKVYERLYKEFWYEVKNRLEEKIKNEIKDKEYVVDESLMVSRKNWDGVCISPDNEDYGIRIDINKIDVVKVGQMISEKNLDGHLGNKTTDTWPIYFINYLNIIGGQVNMLPDTRETKISEMVDIILKYVKVATDVCDEINKMRK